MRGESCNGNNCTACDVVRCADCNTEDENLYYTQVNPSGGYGMHRILVCDNCMKSGRWDHWKSEHWENWPEKRA